MFWTEIGLFAGKSTIIVVAFALIALICSMAIAFLAASSMGRREQGGIEVDNWTDRFRDMRSRMRETLLPKKEFKKLAKAEDKGKKNSKDEKKSRLFIVDFNGDIRASQTRDLREEVSSILLAASSGDEVLLRLETGGGLVTSYGLAASQLVRLRKRGIKLTISVDKIAASGGYMMACVADRILAAPFAVVGSIGVIAQVPNFHKILKKHDVEYKEITAGEYKRTLTIFGEITETGLQKFKSQIEETHVLFKNFVAQNRPSLNIERVATGEYWYGTQALELGLIDEIQTSDDYLFKRFEEENAPELLKIRHVPHKRWSERISESFASVAESTALRLWSELEKLKF